ncbi:hypothetical protein, partial [Candidatus Cyanaurora vandensis]
MINLENLSLLVLALGLGWLPLTTGVFWLLTGRDLTRLGTGNGGVSAAFQQGGMVVGLAVVL